ncbi:unnamed protein product [Lupinus luteus]|uniref:Uncharacterized protein n=1 Tax=Lupinus luteus TaxID=3873 RepID=A0AAV1WVP1_LUPLU
MEKKSNETVEEEVLTSDGNNNELPEDSDRSHSSSNEENEINSECPICRTHYAGQSSLKDDLNYDALISYIYTRVDQDEEEELSFHEDEKKDNKPVRFH